MKKKENIGAERREQRAKSKEQGAKGKEQGAGSEHPFLPIEKACLPVGRGEYGFSREGVKQVKNGISTVLHVKKPSAIGIFFPAEGRISELRAIRACLMIRVFNN